MDDNAGAIVDAYWAALLHDGNVNEMTVLLVDMWRQQQQRPRQQLRLQQHCALNVTHRDFAKVRPT